MSSKVIGIDMGTSNSSVAFMQRGVPSILRSGDRDRDRIVPTVVSLDEKGRVAVGHSALLQIETNPQFTYTGLKRLLGRRADDPQVQSWAEMVSYEIAPGPEGQAWVRGPDRLYSPIELLAHVLRHLRDIARRALADNVERCVLGAPAHFDEVQREALRQCARAAGLEPERLLSEPTAAAVAYGVERGGDKTIAVYDFGGGTFDVTILSIRGQRFKPLATSGDAFLGGEDFDARIVSWVVEQFQAKHEVDLRNDATALARVRMAAETAKHELSGVEVTPLQARFIADKLIDNVKAPLDLSESLERETFEELTSDLVERTRAPCREALKIAGLDPRDLDDVVLVGGMTRMPLVQQVVADIFGRAPKQTVPPLDAVALGCAMQGAALAGQLESLGLSDIAPMSYGVEVGNGTGFPLVRKGASIPARVTKRFRLAEPKGEAAAIRVYQGDLKRAGDNRQLGVLVLNDMQTGAKEPQIDVTFDVSADGILSVYGVNIETKARVDWRIHAETGLSETHVNELRSLTDEFEDQAA